MCGTFQELGTSRIVSLSDMHIQVRINNLVQPVWAITDTWTAQIWFRYNTRYRNDCDYMYHDMDKLWSSVLPFKIIKVATQVYQKWNLQIIPKVALLATFICEKWTHNAKVALPRPILVMKSGLTTDKGITLGIGKVMFYGFHPCCSKFVYFHVIWHR